LVGKVRWGGEDALDDVISSCTGKKDALHQGLMNFACTHKVDGNGLGSDDHLPLLEELPNITKELSYEGKLGFATVIGMQGRTFEAKDIFDKVSKEKAADGTDWLCQRQYGYYLLVVTHEYAEAVKKLAAAFKQNAKRDPMTIGWYMAALSKSGTPQDLQTMATVFDEIGKFHESDTDYAVIREEFLQKFDIKSPLSYESLVKSGPTPLHAARRLICCAKYHRQEIDDFEDKGGILKLLQDIKEKGSMMFKVAIGSFKGQAQWFYNNSTNQLADIMTNAGMLSMDWAMGPTFVAYCQAKMGQIDMAHDSVQYLPQKLYDPMFTCVAMTGEAVSENLEDDKEISPWRFIARINNLRFGAKKTDSDKALKELTTEFLKKYKQDFNALVALADIWLSRGAVRCAYRVYHTIKQLFPIRYKVNFLLRLKFAESMRLNGFQSSALTEFRATYNSFDKTAKKHNEEMKFMSDLLVGYALLCIAVGSYDEAEKVLADCDRKNKLKTLATAHLTLLKGEDAAGVYEKCKEDTENPLMMALAVRAGKMSGADTAAEEAALKKLIGGKFGGIEVVKEFCEISAGIKADSSGQCLTNAILSAVSKAPDSGPKIYNALKGVFEANPSPNADEIFSAVAGCGVAAVGDEANVTVIANAEAPLIEDMTDDYASMAAAAEKEIEAMRSGKVIKSESKSKGKKSKKGKGAAAQKGAAKGAGPKPKVDYKATPMDKRKQWAFEMAAKVPTPTASQAVQWNVDQLGQFIARIPIFGLNEWYGAKMVESQVTGSMFLNCNDADLAKWGVDKRCHRARFRAEALAMKRRG